MRYEFEMELKPVLRKPRGKPGSPTSNVPPIRRTLVMAYQIVGYMAANKIPTMKVFCRQAHVTPARISQITNFLYLSTRIQEEILMEDSPIIDGLRERDIRPLFREVLWSRQEDLWHALQRP